jgi:hypothetical protein
MQNLHAVSKINRSSSMSVFLTLVIPLSLITVSITGRAQRPDANVASSPGQGSEVLIKIARPTATPEVRATRIGDALDTAKITVPAHSTLSKLLQENYVQPDADSLGLIMDLNPGIKRLTDIREGQEVIIPRIKLSMLGYSSKGEKVFTVVAHQEEHKKLDVTIELLDQQLKDAAKIADTQFPTIEAKKAFMEASQATYRLLKKSRTVPLNRQTLMRVNRIARSQSNIIGDVIKDNQFHSDLLTAVNSNRMSLQFVVAMAEDSVNQQPVKVSVTTLKANTNEEAKKLRVRCKYEADYLSDQNHNRNIDVNSIPFDSLTIPGLKGLDDSAYYYLWVVDESTNQRVKEPEKFLIRRDSNPCNTGEHCLQFLVSVR